MDVRRLEHFTLNTWARTKYIKETQTRIYPTNTWTNNNWLGKFECGKRLGKPNKNDSRIGGNAHCILTVLSNIEFIVENTATALYCVYSTLMVKHPNGKFVIQSTTQFCSVWKRNLLFPQRSTIHGIIKIHFRRSFAPPPPIPASHQICQVIKFSRENRINVIILW